MVTPLCEAERRRGASPKRSLLIKGALVPTQQDTKLFRSGRGAKRM